MAGVKLRGLRKHAQTPSTLPQGENHSTPPPQTDRERKAKRNADAYTAFVTLSAVSAGLFLTGTGLTVFHGLKLGKAEGTFRLLNHASEGSEDFFTESGDLSRDAQRQAKSIPGLHSLLLKIEKQSESKNQSVQDTIEDTQDEANAERKKQKKIVMATGIAAGVGLVGMIVFISAAKITKHRGLMLYAPNGKRRAKLNLQPQLSPQLQGLQLSLRW